MTEFNWEAFSKADALDYVAELIGKDFERAVGIANRMRENPANYTGIQAIETAKRLAVFRLWIGAEAERYKLLCQHNPSPQNKMIKGTLIMCFGALEEIINCLKLQSRVEKEILTNG